MAERQNSTVDAMQRRCSSLIIEHQRSLYLYIWSMVHRDDDSHDILQETNLALWKDLERASQVADFRSWACRVAYNQVLAYRKRQSRSRLLFDDSLTNLLAEESQAQDAKAEEYKFALRACAKKLPPQSSRLLALRYQSRQSIRAIAEQLGRSVASVSQSLYRIRADLLKCIRDTLADGDVDMEERR